MKQINMTNFRGKRKAGVDYSLSLRDMLPGLIGEKPMSKREIASATGRNFETVTRLFEKIRGEIHIAAWRRSRVGPPHALWLLGSGKDAPALAPLTSAEKSRRWRQTESGSAAAKAASLRWKRSPAAVEYAKRENAVKRERYHARKRIRAIAKQALASRDPLLAAIMG